MPIKLVSSFLLGFLVFMTLGCLEKEPVPGCDSGGAGIENNPHCGSGGPGNGGGNPSSQIIGQLDTDFGVNGVRSIPVGINWDNSARIVIQADGKIIGVGYSSDGAVVKTTIVRVDSTGAIDSTFGASGVVRVDFGGNPDQFFGVGVQSDGKILAVGNSGNGDFDIALSRHLVSGALDNTFDSDGKVITNIGPADDSAVDIVIQSDGKILVAGQSNNGTDSDFALVRYNSDGSLDTSFGTGGKVTTPVGAGEDLIRAVSLQTDGKIVVAGRSHNGSNYDFAVARYNSNGSLDGSFGSGGVVTTAIGTSDDDAQDVAIQADGKIVVGGYYKIGAIWYFTAVLYNSDGSKDMGFAINGIFTSSVPGGASAVAIQTDGKILLGGGGYSPGSTLVRLNSVGSLDGSFGVNGIVIESGVSGNGITDMALQADGKIVVLGDDNSNGFVFGRFK